MFAVAAGRDVHIGLVAKSSWGLDGIVQVILREFLERVESFLIDQKTLLDPAFEAAGGAYARETFLTLQHLDALSVFYVADAVKDGGNLVAQRSLGRRHVGDLEDVVTPAAARGQQENCRQRHHRNKPGSPE